MQISMFLMLGLQIFPSNIIPVIGPGFLVSAFLIFLARPLSVFISLSFTKITIQEKAFISWVGLRGAVPIILATFPLLAHTPKAEMIFNMVFFIVLISILLHPQCSANCHALECNESQAYRSGVGLLPAERLRTARQAYACSNCPAPTRFSRHRDT